MKVLIAAQTLPQEGASTTILPRLGFTLVGTVDYPEDGPVWEWQLPGNAPSARREDASFLSTGVTGRSMGPEGAKRRASGAMSGTEGEWPCEKSS